MCTFGRELLHQKIKHYLNNSSTDLQGNSIITKSSHFSVSAVTPSKKLVEVQLIEVNPNIEVHVVAPVVVEVKFRGNHIKNSPFYYTLWTWEQNNNNNIIINNNSITSIEKGGWGMIQEQLDMAPKTLNLKIHHFNTDGWCQIHFLYPNTVQLKAGNAEKRAVASFNIRDKPNRGTETNVKIERENNGKVAFFVNGDLEWNKSLPNVYVYVDVYWSTCKAEIV